MELEKVSAGGISTMPMKKTICSLASYVAITVLRLTFSSAQTPFLLVDTITGNVLDRNRGARKCTILRATACVPNTMNLEPLLPQYIKDLKRLILWYQDYFLTVKFLRRAHPLSSGYDPYALQGRYCVLRLMRQLFAF